MYLLTLTLALLAGPLAFAQQNTDPSAALEIDSTTKGFLPPRMTTAQRDAISSPATGLIIFNTNTNIINVYNGTFWDEMKALASTNVDIISSSGKTWMDRNLGATQVAPASNDASSYGYLYQWGRNSDGHQLRTSSTASGPVASGSEGSNFITNGSSPYDWLSPQDNTRWNGATKGAHDPCPTGYRVPTETELDNERPLFPTDNAAGAFASVLKLSVAGYRSSTAAFIGVGNTAYYWSSTVNGTNARYLSFDSNGVYWGSGDRARGFSVRCLKE